MTDRAVVAMALAAAAGAWAAMPVPLVVPIFLAATAFGFHRPWLLGLAVVLAASGLGARAEAGLHPVPTGRFSGVVTLVADPSDGLGGGVTVVVRVGDRRVEAQARGRAGARLRPRLAGERVALSGEFRDLSRAARRYLHPRHVVGRLAVHEVGAWSPGNAPTRLANGVRRTMVAGVQSMAPDRRPLFSGFILGDDRGQRPEVVDDFRGSGLSHLLVVSGQNVAFMLALASPVLLRLGLGWRFVAALAVLGIFGVLTRWEPSVLRAEAMAALSLLATTIGRPASGLRVLALAVTGLLLVDPFLVRSLGFLLSVGASAGIALLSRPLAALVPGPRFLAEALGVTLAAQIGVAPILIPVFGGVPVACIPANLLAAPMAAPVMIWGVVAGIPAGLVGGTFAHIVHLPTSAMIAWTAGVARWGASIPMGELGPAHAVVLGVAVGVGRWSGRSRGGRLIARAAGALAAVAVAAPAVAALHPAPLDARTAAAGATVWRRGGATVLVVDASSASPDRLLAGLRALGVRSLDVVVVEPPGIKAAAAVEPTLRRMAVSLLLAPESSPLPDALHPRPGERIRAGPLEVKVTEVVPRLKVSVASFA